MRPVLFFVVLSCVFIASCASKVLVCPIDCTTTPAVHQQIHKCMQHEFDKVMSHSATELPSWNETDIVVLLSGVCAADTLVPQPVRSMTFVGPAVVVGAPVPLNACKDTADDQTLLFVYNRKPVVTNTSLSYMNLEFDGDDTLHELFGKWDGTPTYVYGNITMENCHFRRFRNEWIVGLTAKNADIHMTFRNNTANGSVGTWGIGTNWFFITHGTENVQMIDNQCLYCACTYWDTGFNVKIPSVVPSESTVVHNNTCIPHDKSDLCVIPQSAKPCPGAKSSGLENCIEASAVGECWSIFYRSAEFGESL